MSEPGFEQLLGSEIDDPAHALHRIGVGVGVLERRLAQPAEAADDELLMASLALSLERMAREAQAASDATDDQREQLRDAERRIRHVIDELAVRERRRLQAVTSPLAVSPPPTPAVVVEPSPVTVPAGGWDRPRVLRLTGQGLMAFGVVLALFLAFEFLFTSALEARSQRSLIAAFQRQLKVGPFDDPSAPVASGPVALLDVRSIGLHQAVIQGSSPESLKQGPGHLSASPLPGEFGNAVIVGHRRTYGAPFARLGSLAVGARIQVLTGQGRFVYRVTSVSVVRPGQGDVVGPSLDSRLTLVTSAALASGDRQAVVAKLVGNPVAVPTRPQTPVAAGELGTQGDTAGLYLAIILGFGLTALALLARRLYLTWPLKAAYLVSTPPLLVALWLVFQNLDRFLPGTL
ncbi:MAG: sortase [Gaiellales bacterium]|nr:sortase [Gaiellales bacterium]